VSRWNRHQSSLNAALQEVNWSEIAEHYVAEIDRVQIETEETDAVKTE
jgi:hypothetical protein